MPMPSTALAGNTTVATTHSLHLSSSSSSSSSSSTDSKDGRELVTIGPIVPDYMDPDKNGIAAPPRGKLWRCDTNRKSPTFANVLKAAEAFEGMGDERLCKRDPYNPKGMHFTGTYEQMWSDDGVHVYIHGYLGQDYCKAVGVQLRMLARQCMWNFPMEDGVERVGGAIYLLNNPRTLTWISVTQKPLDWHAPA